MPEVLETIEENKELVIVDRIDLLLTKLEKLEKKIDKLETAMEKNGINCEKMSNHIDFIESVYNKFRSPLEYMRYKLGFSDSNSLPDLDVKYSEIENLKKTTHKKQCQL